MFHWFLVADSSFVQFARFIEILFSGHIALFFVCVAAVAAQCQGSPLMPPMALKRPWPQACYDTQSPRLYQVSIVCQYALDCLPFFLSRLKDWRRSPRPKRFCVPVEAHQKQHKTTCIMSDCGFLCTSFMTINIVKRDLR